MQTTTSKQTHKEPRARPEPRAHRALTRLGALAERVGTFIRSHPFGAVAGALGVGFVLGGGLTPRVIGVCLRIASLAALPILQQKIVHAVTRSTSHIDEENHR